MMTGKIATVLRALFFASFVTSVMISWEDSGAASTFSGSTANGGATTTFARAGFAHGPASGTTSTARRGGVVQLVTPIQIATTLPGLERIGFIAQLTLVFVPEPGTALLLGAGVVLLALMSPERRRRQDRRIPLP